MLHFIPLRFIEDNSFAGFKRKMIRKILLERNLKNPTLPGILLARSSNSSDVKKTQHFVNLVHLVEIFEMPTFLSNSSTLLCHFF